MKLKPSSIICMAIALGMLFIACARPPVEEMQNASEAVSRAENDIDAITYAGNLVARAKDALAQMYNEADSKNFDLASIYAAEAITIAERAITEGRAAAERAQDEASTLVLGLGPLVEETRNGIDAAYSAELQLDYDAVERNFETAFNNVEQAHDALNGSDYLDAMRLGRTARSELADINYQISSAAIAVPRRK